MDYTDTYRKIYKVVSQLDLPHEKKHSAALRITDALSDIYHYTNRQFPDILPDILNIVQDFSVQTKIGGYDLDDKGQPINYGTNPAGLNSNK